MKLYLWISLMGGNNISSAKEDGIGLELFLPRNMQRLS